MSRNRKVLIVGSGAREHALAWKLYQDGCRDIYVARGNAGTAEIAENLSISHDNIPELIHFARTNVVDLTIIGPDDCLALGIVDAFQEAGLLVFGPTKKAARIEWSKSFAKELMSKTKIPTAAYSNFFDPSSAINYVRMQNRPVVVKASGLALGKGAYVCKTTTEAEAAIKEIMVDKKLGESGNEVVIEEYLNGMEFSAHAIASGTDYILFPFAQDHKPVGDGNIGPMTGGMGTIAPVPWVTEEMKEELEREVVEKILNELDSISLPFVGCLYPGIMQTASGPKVIEFNARFGDPEIEVYVRLLKSDLFELLEAAALGDLGRARVKWQRGAAACIMLTSGGYPGPYEKGYPITGIKEAEKLEDVVVFQGGTKKSETGEVVTNGGRVLGVTAYGDNLDEALALAYKAVGLISFQGMYYRKDIGQASLSMLK